LAEDLLKFITEHYDRGHLVYALLNKTTQPSYGHFLERGETAWPEYWNVDVPSRIHTCYTGIASYFIKSMAGIHAAGRSRVFARKSTGRP